MILVFIEQSLSLQRVKRKENWSMITNIHIANLNIYIHHSLNAISPNHFATIIAPLCLVFSFVFAKSKVKTRA
jgi:hypothetical protein